MASYSKIVTNAGLTLLSQVANGHGTLQWTEIKTGSGAIGSGSAAALTDIIATVQTFSAVDVMEDSLNNAFIYCVLTNEGLAAGYTMREVGIYGRLQGTSSDTLIIYLWAAPDSNADYIPAPGTGIATVSPFRVQVAESAGVGNAVTVDHSTVFLSLDRWAQHLAAAGGVDQHPIATSGAAGMLAAADKTKLDAHINPVSPTSGTTVHGVATGTTAGFESAADKTKLDGIQAGAQVNQPAFGAINMNLHYQYANAPGDIFGLMAGDNIDIEPDGPETYLIKAVNIVPSSHIGSGGSQHANATESIAGFESASDKTKLDGIAAGAQVNQPAFAVVRAGIPDLSAQNPGDRLTLADGPMILVTGDISSLKATFSLGLPYYAMKCNLATQGDGTLTWFLPDANTVPCGMLVSPKGGINWHAHYGGGITTFEMLVNNQSSGAVVRSIVVPYCDNRLYCQIDSGTIVFLITGLGGPNTVSISIPAGQHIVRWYLVNNWGEGYTDSSLVLPDWLDNTVVWAAGGIYY